MPKDQTLPWSSFTHCSDMVSCRLSTPTMRCSLANEAGGRSRVAGVVVAFCLADLIACNAPPTTGGVFFFSTTIISSCFSTFFKRTGDATLVRSFASLFASTFLLFDVGGGNDGGKHGGVAFPRLDSLDGGRGGGSGGGRGAGAAACAESCDGRGSGLE